MNKLITYISYGAIILLAIYAGEAMNPLPDAPRHPVIETNEIPASTQPQNPAIVKESINMEVHPQISTINQKFNH